VDPLQFCAGATWQRCSGRNIQIPDIAKGTCSYGSSGDEPGYISDLACLRNPLGRSRDDKTAAAVERTSRAKISPSIRRSCMVGSAPLVRAGVPQTAAITLSRTSLSIRKLIYNQPGLLG
jgi:hypothetical protein